MATRPEPAMHHRGSFSEAFGAQGDHAFQVWSYAGTASLDEILTPGYFHLPGDIVRRGDLIWAGLERPHSHFNRKLPILRRCLLMVRHVDERGRPHMRLALDLGGPDDPDAPRWDAFATDEADAQATPEPAKPTRAKKLRQPTNPGRFTRFIRPSFHQARL